MSTPSQTSDYIVFARKYRPRTLDDVVGQPTLVRALDQAISSQTLSHAILLHGIRGVGKTTTARIIAKGLNCEKGPTAHPCGACGSCTAQKNDAHLDVIEMDAASHTGVDDVRELIETAKYRAVQGRFKVYIIDEVHMLSKSAFNALLKTLEEPPPAVKFIFATTEIQKIPDTIISRCMRFDLARMDVDTIKARLQWIASQEHFEVEDDASILIARAAEGSMRDALSLLDQAYLLSGHQNIRTHTVRSMLGLSSRDVIYNLIHAVLSGDIPAVLTQCDACQSQGADALSLLKDILDVIYTMICIKSAPATSKTLTHEEQQQISRILTGISLPSLLQVWQVLNDRYDKIYKAPHPDQAFHVALLQVCYLSALPPLDALINGQAQPQTPTSKIEPPQKHTHTAHTEQTPNEPVPAEEASSDVAIPSSFDALLTLLKAHKELILYAHLHGDIALDTFDPSQPKLSFFSKNTAPENLSSRLKDVLLRITHTRWVIENLGPAGKDHTSCLDQDMAHAQQAFEDAQKKPFVQDILTQFPGAKVTRAS